MADPNAGLALELVRRDWAWAGISPDTIFNVNVFGGILLTDTRGIAWVVSPHEVDAYAITDLPGQITNFVNDPQFMSDWFAKDIAHRLHAALGPLSMGQCYAKLIPEALGGRDDVSNYRIESLDVFSARMGTLAEAVTTAHGQCDVAVDIAQDGTPVFEVLDPDHPPG